MRGKNLQLMATSCLIKAFGRHVHLLDSDQREIEIVKS